jgi:aminoglycoside phosphotransferase (APT) family kinase protein
MPYDDDLVLSHGDFTREQVVTTPSGPVLLDADTVALAPRGLDVAAYPANLASGRPGDADRLDEALDALLDGYGTAIRYLDWHLAAALLRRCDRPLRRLKSRWPERTQTLLDTTEEVTRRCSAVRT